MRCRASAEAGSKENQEIDGRGVQYLDKVLSRRTVGLRIARAAYRQLHPHLIHRERRQAQQVPLPLGGRELPVTLEGLPALEHQHVPCLMGEETLDGDLFGDLDGYRVHHDDGRALGPRPAARGGPPPPASPRPCWPAAISSSAIQGIWSRGWTKASSAMPTTRSSSRSRSSQ